MLNINKFHKVLVLCAHTDDEFGCAGTIIKLANSNSKIHYVAFSRCEDSVPDGYPLDILEKECIAAMCEMGLDRNNINVDRFRVRHFPKHRQEILEKLVKLNKDLKPDLVLLPCSKDIHQDHKTIYEEGVRAFKFSSILGYELPQNTFSFSHAAFIELEEDLINQKIKCMAKYESQSFRKYANEVFIKSLARVRGVQCGSIYAEAFEAIRIIL
tara:strand:+ start:2371 stop:3009 length:639 start_codon:yes stop_codon:yes gene_type:complete